MPITDPSKWTGRWSAGITAHAGDWSTNLIAAVPTMGAKAAAAVTVWQAAVQDPAAALAYADGERTFDQTAAIATINGAGKTKYMAAATTKNAGYATFATSFGPALQTEINTLNTTNPRGPRGTNQARMIAFNDWITAQRGKYSS